MAEPVDESRIDKALSESQRLEREEQQADLERQRAADERVVDALAAKETDTD